MSADPYVSYTRRFFGRWSPVYDLLARPLGPIYRRAARLAVTRRDTRVLDLCSGTGEMSRRVDALGGIVTAVDLTPAMLLRGVRKNVSRTVLGDARQLPFGDRTFEVAVVSFALHDMPRPVRLLVLAEARRLARRRLVVLDYSVPPWRWAARAWVGAVGRFESAYYRSFVRDGLATLLDELDLGLASSTPLWGGLFAVTVVPLDR